MYSQVRLTDAFACIRLFVRCAARSGFVTGYYEDMNLVLIPDHTLVNVGFQYQTELAACLSPRK